jgi:hypothetical protein
VEVRRGLRGLGRAPGLTSTVTYQVGDISDPQERALGGGRRVHSDQHSNSTTEPTLVVPKDSVLGRRFNFSFCPTGPLAL